MASIKISSGADDKLRYYVHWQDEDSGHGRRRIFRNIDDAAYFLWQRENIGFGSRTADWTGADRSWTLQKLLYYFLGAQGNKLQKNHIRLSSYTKCRQDILAVQGTILGKSILRITHHDIVNTIRCSCHRWIRSAFGLMIEKRLIAFNPVERPARRHRRPITIPPGAAVRKLLDNAPVRERKACWFGICGLRIGEALAVTYADVTAEWIDIRKHIVDGVIHEGLKRGVERRVRMPRELFELLDKSKLGTPEPVISNSFTCAPLSISYSTQGVLLKTLNTHGIKRFHHLRHFAVSRLANKGVDILKVSRLIGHSNIKTTMDVYGHLFGEVVAMDLD